MEDTIAAVATAYGEGGIGIIRVSGPLAFAVLGKVFSPGRPAEYQGEMNARAGVKSDEKYDVNTKLNNTSATDYMEHVGTGSEFFQSIPSIINRRFVYGHVIDASNAQVVDEVLAVCMKAPATYTKEDVVEIHCHGSSIALRRTLELVLGAGARLAEPGEFTKRAFLNGRLDLSQAESVIDLIKAKTDRGYHLALEQLSGSLSSAVQKLRAPLLELLAHLVVSLDFPEEDVEAVTYQQAEEGLVECLHGVNSLLATAEAGRIIREGLRAAIAGKPNVGKSSLMNALLRESRAIVTEIPGTTRDTIEEVLNIGGIPVQLTDTAGIRETEDKIERLGIERSKEALQRADLVVFMLDGSRGLAEEDLEIARQIGEKPCIVLVNKTDLGKVLTEEEILDLLPGAWLIDSAVTEAVGIKELEERIVSLVYGGNVRQEESLLVSNARQKALLVQTAGELEEALRMLQQQEPLDFVEITVRRAWELLGEILGETVNEDIINEVFSRFCLGK